MGWALQLSSLDLWKGCFSSLATSNLFVLVSLFWFFGGHTRQSSGLTPGSVTRNHSYDSGGQTGRKNQVPVSSCAKQSTDLYTIILVVLQSISQFNAATNFLFCLHASLPRSLQNLCPQKLHCHQGTKQPTRLTYVSVPVISSLYPTSVSLLYN